ncbi:putative peptidyl-tRNA hydrolase PTRHD1 [Moschus berezovskii]|uniref:putative peptidyl-tRNA hydrolase PTRHD1 n=1 Tax=Moschus berezovskii TaxID=68408 RepID=UPI0024452CC9|nr:putative peptidyl-tRNA hydrolase PTRHD1 [Moschus berezovskii]
MMLEKEEHLVACDRGLDFIKELRKVDLKDQNTSAGTNPNSSNRPAFQLNRKMAASGGEPQILVQYLVLRKDLSQAPFSWPAGAVVAQACHAATAALHLHRDHPHTAAYLRELERMRKVVLEAPDETTLKLLAETLQQKNIDHKLWMEQPENMPTCIALRSYPKEEVSRYLKKFRLFQ